MNSDRAGIDERIDHIDTSDGPMAVVVKQPVGDVEHPTVVLFHDAPGVRDATHVFARRLAGVGYRVAVPDLYHRLGRLIGFSPADAANDPDVPARVRSMLKTLTDDGIQRDLDATLGLVGETEPMGCIGFCLGARAVFRTMQRLPETLVVGAMWHPSFLVDDGDDSPHLTASMLQGPLYIGQGDADTIMSVETNQPFFDAVSERPDETIVDIHPGADHGYTWPDSPKFDEAAAERSWEQTLRLLSINLG